MYKRWDVIWSPRYRKGVFKRERVQKIHEDVAWIVGFEYEETLGRLDLLSCSDGG